MGINSVTIEKEISVSGRVVRIAKLRHEWFDFLDDPPTAVKRIRQEGKFADLFTFLRDIGDDDVAIHFTRKQPVPPFFR